MPDEELQAAGSDPPLSPEEEAALGEDVDLDMDMRRRVLIAARDLHELDHYALLGVDQTADKKALKRAYYEFAAKFHPDRYFRKKLGTYKVRMEAIFARVTLAHDTLTDRERRAEYDAYLEEQHRSRGIEQLLAEAMAEAKRAGEKVEREVRAQQPDAAAAAAPAPSAPPAQAPAAAPSARPPGPTVALDARRDALARRLLGGRPLSPSSRPSAPSASRPTQPAPAAAAPHTPSTADAMQALRRRYEERVGQAKAAQSRKYVANAEAALAAGDVVAAANAFRVARTLSQDDPDIERRAVEAQARADAVLGDTYTKQAQYEEKNGQWPEAARSWARVCSVRRQDAHAHDRAAHAIVKASGDLHEASRLAQHACELEPGSARYRLTLAIVFTAAGLPLRARRELDTAAQLAPHDGTIQAMLRSAGKPA